MSWENVDDLFKELDKKEYHFVSASLWTYMKSLMDSGFSRREAFNLVQGYGKFIYDMTLEEFISNRRMEEDRAFKEEEKDDVDPFDDDEL